MKTKNYVYLKISGMQKFAWGLALISAFEISHAETLNINTNAYGNSWGEWSARWVQWALSIPEATSPLKDPSGANCALGQSGPVWFLAGTLGGDATRSCTIPVGKALFFPLVAGMFGSGIFDCEPTVPGTPCILPTIRKSAADSMDDVTLEATVDGKKLKNLNGLRVVSPVYALTLPDANILGVPAGIYSPNVADGYYVLLKPLKPGAHTINFKTRINSGVFAGTAGQVTYNLTVGTSQPSNSNTCLTGCDGPG